MHLSDSSRMRGASILGVVALLALLSVTAVAVDSVDVNQSAMFAAAPAPFCVTFNGKDVCEDDKTKELGRECATINGKEVCGFRVNSSLYNALRCTAGADFILKMNSDAQSGVIYYSDSAGNPAQLNTLQCPSTSQRTTNAGTIPARSCDPKASNTWKCYLTVCRVSATTGKEVCAVASREDKPDAKPIPVGNLISQGVSTSQTTTPTPSSGDPSILTSTSVSDDEKKGIVTNLDESTRAQWGNAYQEEDAKLAQQQAEKQKEVDAAEEAYNRLRNCTQSNQCGSEEERRRAEELLKEREAQLRGIEDSRLRLAQAQEFLKAPTRPPRGDIQNPPGNPPYNPYVGGGGGTFGDGQPWYVTRPAYGDYGATPSGNDAYCVTNQYPLMVEQRPATPGCINYRAPSSQQQCNSQQGGLFGTILSLFMKNKSGCGANGNGNDSDAPTPTCQITASPQNISTGGQQVTLSWQSARAFQASLSSAGNVATNGSMTVTPQTTTTYTLNVGGAMDSRTGKQLSGQCSVQVVVGGQGGGDGSPKAEISCRPQEADVGMSIAVSYACRNSATSGGSGFSTNNQLSGSATPTVEAPTLGSDSVIYGLTCSKDGKTDSAQCVVKINSTSMVLIVNPKDVASGEEANIGWITSGMESCTISSPTLSSFTSNNAGNTSPSGVAKTSSLVEDTTFVLTCTTKSGGTKTAETTVNVVD